MTPRRILTPRQADAQRDGSTRIAPGIWVDGAGDLHFSVPELLAVFGWPDDAEHRAIVEQSIRETAADQFPELSIVEQELES